MIKRAPRPKHSYTVLRDDVIRDPNLSYRASGILNDILSRPDNWTASAENLAAARPGKEGVRAILRALRELDEAGYLKRERVRCDDGRFAWIQTVFDTPKSDRVTTAEDVSAGQTISPKPSDGFPSDGNRRSKEVPRRSTEKHEVKWPDSGRFAPSVGATGNDHDSVSTWPPEDNEPPHVVEWRADDKNLFRELLGSRIQSRGLKNWNPGLFSTDALYEALRAGGPGRKKIDWPGLYLSRINEGQTSAGLVNWLDDQGFDLVDPGITEAA